jgi:hypothetical protein
VPHCGCFSAVKKPVLIFLLPERKRSGWGLLIDSAGFFYNLLIQLMALLIYIQQTSFLQTFLGQEGGIE